MRPPIRSDASTSSHSTPARSRPLFWEYGRNETFFKYPGKDERSPNLALREGTVDAGEAAP